MDQDKRELGQARNIVDRILKHDSTAKILVHAGYDHIDESGLLGGAKPMAVRFRELTGIDPLTVDQTVMTDMGVDRFDDDRYRFVIDTFHPTEPIVLERESTIWSASPGVHDVSVIHPRIHYVDGRPTCGASASADAKLIHSATRS